MRTDVALRVLGPVDALVGGQPTSVGPPKARHVLAALVLDVGRTVLVERLVDEVWGESPPATAREALHVQVSKLRGTLGEVLLTDSGGYRLAVDPTRVDLARFERLAGSGRSLTGAGRHHEAGVVLREALALWRGAAFEGLDGERVAAERRRLDELRLHVLEDRTEADLSGGPTAALLAELEALTAEHPLRERFWAQRMRALYAAGRQADALRAYTACREVLAEELGLEPGTALRELEAAILRQDPALEGPTPSRPPEVVAHLEVAGPGQVRVVPLTDAVATIGRAAGNAVCIDWDPLVSSQHAALARVDGRWVLRDLGSRNGTRHNGARIEGPVEVGEADEVAVGITRLRLLPAGPVSAPLPTIGQSGTWTALS